MDTVVGDGMSPVYEFDWGDHSRTTEALPDVSGRTVNKTEAVETLAQLGRDDPECDVTLLRFE